MTVVAAGDRVTPAESLCAVNCVEAYQSIGESHDRTIWWKGREGKSAGLNCFQVSASNSSQAAAAAPDRVC